MMITILVISDFALYTLQESILIRELGFCKRHSQELQYYITAKCKIIFFSVLFHFTSFNWFLWIDKKKLSNQSSSKRVKLHFEHRWDVTEKLKSSYILMPPRCNWFWAFQLHPSTFNWWFDQITDHLTLSGLILRMLLFKSKWHMIKDLPHPFPLRW